MLSFIAGTNFLLAIIWYLERSFFKLGRPRLDTEAVRKRSRQQKQNKNAHKTKTKDVVSSRVGREVCVWVEQYSTKLIKKLPPRSGDAAHLLLFIVKQSTERPGGKVIAVAVVVV